MTSSGPRPITGEPLISSEKTGYAPSSSCPLSLPLGPGFPWLARTARLLTGSPTGAQTSPSGLGR